MNLNKIQLNKKIIAEEYIQCSMVYKELENTNTIYSLGLHAHMEKHVCQLPLSGSL